MDVVAGMAGTVKIVAHTTNNTSVLRSLKSIQ